MTREEVVQLFKFLKNIYPTFEVSTDKVDTWTRIMQKMDYQRVMVKAEKHASENKFPPTIAEISAFAPEKNETLEKMKQWKKEADQVPESVKQEFRKKLEQLMKDKNV